jgi:hypothetical protein
VGTAVGLRALLAQGPDPLVGIANQPAVQRAAVHPIADGHIGDRGAGVEHLSNGEIALLKHRKLRQCHDRLLGSDATQPRSERSLGQWTEWDTGTEATVAQVLKPGRKVRQGSRSQSGTELPNFYI